MKKPFLKDLSFVSFLLVILFLGTSINSIEAVKTITPHNQVDSLPLFVIENRLTQMERECIELSEYYDSLEKSRPQSINFEK